MNQFIEKLHIIMICHNLYRLIHMNRYCRKKVVDLYVVGTSREDEINGIISMNKIMGTDKDYDDYDMGIKKDEQCSSKMTLFPIE